MGNSSSRGSRRAAKWRSLQSSNVRAPTAPSNVRTQLSKTASAVWQAEPGQKPVLQVARPDNRSPTCEGSSSQPARPCTASALSNRTGLLMAAVRADQARRAREAVGLHRPEAPYRPQSYPLFWVYLGRRLSTGYWLKRGSVRIAVLPRGSSLSRSMHRLFRPFHRRGARPCTAKPGLDRAGFLMRALWAFLRPSAPVIPATHNQPCQQRRELPTRS
jgi:hypothetical protein